MTHFLKKRNTYSGSPANKKTRKINREDKCE